MYTSIQTHSHKIGQSTAVHFPKRSTKQGTKRNRSQDLPALQNGALAKEWLSTKVTKNHHTIYLCGSACNVGSFVNYSKRYQYQCLEKHPVKISHLCKNVVAGQVLAGEVSL